MTLFFLPPKRGGTGVGDYAIYLLQWILMPFTLIAFGAIPGI